jgi:O-antigen ligase
MPNTLNTLILIGGAMLAALIAALSMASVVHVASRRGQGFMHLIFYAMLLAVAAGSLLSGRDLTSQPLTEELPLALVAHPVMRVLQPLISLLILTVSAERLIAHWLQRKTAATPLLLCFSFFAFWASTVASPALLGAHPQLTHDYAYPLVIGLAATLATSVERDQALKAVRNAMLVFMLLSFMLAVVSPGLVMDRSYTQGLLPGLPRFAGLSPHAVGMGLMTQLGLLCLMTRPYERPWLNRLAWTVGLSTLFLAQSKTAWLAFFICTGTWLAVQRGPAMWQRLTDPMQPTLGLTTLVGGMLGLVALAAVLMFGNLGEQLSAFVNTPEGAQLASFTGRDRIWVIAFDEWQRNPVFGYGPGIWDERFRASIGMSNANHAHNQFMDTLSRAGLVGATGLTLYALLLLVLSVRLTRATQGLSLALFLALVLRSISEVPLLMFGYSTEMFIHVLLLMVLAPALHRQPAAAQQATRTASSASWSFSRPMATSKNRHSQVHAMKSTP